MQYYVNYVTSFSRDCWDLRLRNAENVETTASCSEASQGHSLVQAGTSGFHTNVRGPDRR